MMEGHEERTLKKEQKFQIRLKNRARPINFVFIPLSGSNSASIMGPILTELCVADLHSILCSSFDCLK
jgi:hypothetical protein